MTQYVSCLGNALQAAGPGASEAVVEVIVPGTEVQRVVQGVLYCGPLLLPRVPGLMSSRLVSIIIELY